MEKDKFLEDLDCDSCKIESYYETKYSYEATVLFYFNHQVKNIYWKEGEVNPYYVFDDTKELRETLDKYHKQQIRCEPKELFHSFRDLMKLKEIYEGNAKLPKPE